MPWPIDTSDLLPLLSGLLGLLVGLALGRMRLRRKEGSVRQGNWKGDKAFLKGIQYILSNDHDHAIEEFTKSVQVNSDTIETYVALGNLYRSRGDIERAIRIRQNIILRPNIDEQIRLNALYDLGLDYRKGGLLNRALDTFLKVVQSDPSNLRALEQIEKLYEELKDWKNAYATRQKIARLAQGNHAHILAHHLVEIGKVLHKEGDLPKAASYYNKAISTHRQCLDAYLHLGDLHFEKQEYKKAFNAWKKVVQVAPRYTFLAYRRLEGAFARMQNLKPVEEFLRECAQADSDAYTHLALARYLYRERDVEGALKELSDALDLAPTFWEARKLEGEILLVEGREREALEAYRDLIGRLDVPYLRFQCSQCGFQPKDLQWQCPQCRRWDTIGLVEAELPEYSPAEGPKLPNPHGEKGGGGEAGG